MDIPITTGLLAPPSWYYLENHQGPTWCWDWGLPVSPKINELLADAAYSRSSKRKAIHWLMIFHWFVPLVYDICLRICTDLGNLKVPVPSHVLLTCDHFGWADLPCSPYLGCPLQPIPPYLPISTGWAKDTLVSYSQVTYHVPGFHSHQVQSLGTFTIDGIHPPSRCQKEKLPLFNAHAFVSLITDLFYLVGGLEHLLIFHNIWDNPSQLTFIFFKMLKTWLLHHQPVMVWAQFPVKPCFLAWAFPPAGAWRVRRWICRTSASRCWRTVASASKPARPSGYPWPTRPCAMHAMPKNDGNFGGKGDSGVQGSWLMLRSLSFFLKQYKIYSVTSC